jgi:predicted ATPase
LRQLQGHSLVLAEADPGEPGEDEEMRFRLLETVREFADEQLSEDERTETRRRHAAHFVAWAESASAGLAGPDQKGG